ncbi:protein of unknown function DUF214 [Thermoanaerobacterium xylanolyticum LX-11]|uniref:Cell division protein FtsX n=1 Tax=Thermoanaerobacterium xylanolyticum (strain ATCC 49914 / DSM 7097 / LX-11) TaxID=858215 RepID=F6BHI7_THEXL|nr:permease-like cell division protein FtsX [Thermoanaerobacterium xylanolyticum]AEF16568.1 protein of unknown function DUF214 [Thermoanaerobacterium xylanolyticum LX-11]
MKLNTAAYYIREGLTNVKRNRAMTVASITSVTAALLILGLFLIIILNVDSMASQVESQLELKAFINDNYDAAEVAKVGEEIKAISGVKSITFESKKDALNNFKKQLGDKSYLVNGLENDNPMPQSFIVKVTDANMMKQVSEKIKKIDGVTQVSYGQDVVDKLLGIIKIIRIVGLFVILILFIISVVIISNTIKLGVFARRREINIMKYIGATDWFIRWPFLVEGIVLGLVGSVLAIAILGFIYGYASDLVNNKLIIFTLLPAGVVIRQSLVYFLAMGSLIGAIGSGISIKRFLNV